MPKPFNYETDLLKSLSRFNQSNEIFRSHTDATKISEYLSINSAAAFAKEMSQLTGAAYEFSEAAKLRDEFAIGSAAQAWKDLTSASLDLRTALGDVQAIDAFRSLSALIDSESLGTDLRSYTGTLQTMGFASEIATLTTKLSTSPSVVDSDIVRTYLSSISAVRALEFSLASIHSAHPTSSSNPLLSGITAGTANLLRRDVSDLAGVARFGVMDAQSTFATSLLWPALEIYTAANLARAMVFEESDDDHDERVERVIEERIDSFETLLAALDPELIVPYKGALAALERGGPDWPRHVMTSLRELTTQVLHKLAPDEVILPSASPDDLHEGKPTRRFRISYIYTRVQGASFAEFIEFDIKATIHLFGVLNAETHGIGRVVSPAQARYITARVVGLLTSMLEAAKTAS